MAKTLPNLYKDLYDHKFCKVYDERGVVTEEDMVIEYDELIREIMSYGRLKPAAKRNVRELQLDLNYIVEKKNGGYAFVYNYHGVPPEDLYPENHDGEITVCVKRKNDSDRLPVPIRISENTVLSKVCCYTMRSNISNGNVKLRSDNIVIYGTKIILCPWCGMPVSKMID